MVKRKQRRGKKNGKDAGHFLEQAAGDSKTAEIFPTEKAGIEIGTSSIIGTRSSQQDSLFAYGNEKETIAIVCDGMGGLAGGEAASRTAVQSLTDAWFSKGEKENLPEFLKNEAKIADEKVFSLENEKGDKLEAGTTIVAVAVREEELYWLSVGDSRIYIVRGEEILAVCKPHNYRMTLDQKLRDKELTPEQYKAEEYRAEALTSYLGIGGVSLMEINRQPFQLEKGDIVLLSSDGLYKSLSEEEIFAIVRENEKDMQKLADRLTAGALEKKKTGQDNTSVVALRYGGASR